MRNRPGLPSGLAALLMSRVERVLDGAQQVLRAASVAGRRSGDDLVRAASGLPDAAYDEAVREAVTNQLLVPDGADGYAFRHALLREAVYSDLLPGERTRLHGQLAALLADVPGAAAELAHHSLASHDVPGAFVASIRAGDEARRLGAPTEAHRHYDRALSLWDRVDDAAGIAGSAAAGLASSRRRPRSRPATCPVRCTCCGGSGRRWPTPRAVLPQARKIPDAAQSHRRAAGVFPARERGR